MNQWKVSGNSHSMIWLFAMFFVLVGAINAINAFADQGQALWLLLAPPVLLMGYLGWRLLQATYLSLQGSYLIITRGSDKTEHLVKEIKVTYGRFTYPNMGAYGTIIFVKTPKKRLRFAVPGLLFAPEFYTEPDGYSYDFSLGEHEGKQFSERLSEALKANNMIRLEAKESPFRGAGELQANSQAPRALAGSLGAPFSIELRQALGALQIFKYMGVMLVFIGALNLSIFGLEPLIGPMNAQYAGMAIFIPLLLYGIFRLAKGGNASYYIQYQNNTLSLSTPKKIEASCSREEARVEKGHYTMSSRGGTFTYPVILVQLPGRRPLKLGTYYHCPWGKSGRKMGAPTYIIGPPEFELFRKSFGLN